MFMRSNQVSPSSSSSSSSSSSFLISSWMLQTWRPTSRATSWRTWSCWSSWSRSSCCCTTRLPTAPAATSCGTWRKPWPSASSPSTCPPPRGPSSDLLTFHELTEYSSETRWHCAEMGRCKWKRKIRHCPAQIFDSVRDANMLFCYHSTDCYESVCLPCWYLSTLTYSNIQRPS